MVGRNGITQRERVDPKTLFEILEAVELVARRDDSAVLVRDGAVIVSSQQSNTGSQLRGA